MKRFLDTSWIIALGPDGTTELEYSAVITTYVQQEVNNYNLILPSDTTIIFTPALSDFGNPICEGEWGKCYKWQDSSSNKNIEIYHYSRPFGPKAPCGCDATAQIFFNNRTFLCCEAVLNRNADFSNVTGTILHPEILYPHTGDKCLGQTCKFIHSVVNLDYQSNSSS